MKKLPVGIQSFEVIRTEDYCYVEKTPFVEKLVSEEKYYFLGRGVSGKASFLRPCGRPSSAEGNFFKAFT